MAGLSKNSWVRRSYVCDACDHKFEHTCRRDDPDPACPKCEYAEAQRDMEAEQRKSDQRFQEMIDSGKAPAVTTHKSKAIDITQQVAEGMGLTDMRDNVRAGESYFKPETPMSTSEAQQQARELIGAMQAAPQMEAVAPPLQAFTGTPDPVRSFWGGSGSVQGDPGPQGGAPANVTASAPAAAAARADGSDPMAKLHDAGKKGLLKNNYNVMGACKLDGVKT